MGNKLQQIKSLLLTFLNIRTCIIVIALLALIFPTKFPFTRAMNSVIFKTGSRLISTPDVDNEVVIVHLPPNLINSLTRRPSSVPYFNKFLHNMNGFHPASMAIILEDLSHVVIKDVYVKISLQFLKGKTKYRIKTRKRFQSDYYGFDGNLSETIRKNNIIIANTPFESANHTGGQYSSMDINIPSSIEIEPIDPVKYPRIKKVIDVLAGYDMPAKPLLLNSSAIPFSRYMNSYEIVPVFSKVGSRISHPLIWEFMGKTIPDLTTLIYARLTGSRSIQWTEGTELQFEFSKIQTDHGGNIQPLFSKSNREIPQYSLSEILSNKRLNFLRNKVILIGRNNDPVLENTAYTLLSMRAGFFSFTPSWAVFFGKLIIILLLLFLLFIFSKFQSPLDILLSAGIIFGVITLQLVSLILFKLWIPMAVCVLFFIAGSVLYISKNFYKNRFDKINDERDDALLNLGRIQFDNRQFDQAFLNLRRCETTDEVLEIIYNVGIEFQRRNQFNKAISVFSYIIDKRNEFKDAADRMQHLSDFMRGKIKKKSEDGTDTLDIPHIEINRLVLGRYEVEKELGRGAMGIVYLCKDPKIGRMLAVKTLDFSRLIEGDIDKAKYRFFQEAKTIGMLNHPNLVMVYDVGEEDQIAFIAMDYVPGKNLNNFVKKSKLLPVTDVFQICAKVSEALDYAHGQNVIHRDIKPGNILYSKKLNIIKVTDFGIARMMDSQQTRSDIILGSPSYMSPEQLRSSKIDGRSDIFSLGVTFYQLLTGHYPFEGTDLAKITYKITKAKPVDVRELRPELPEIASNILDKALQKTPDKRFQTAKEMANALWKGLEVISKK